MRIFWTDKEDAILRNNYKTHSRNELMSLLFEAGFDRSYFSVKERLKRLGLSLTKEEVLKRCTKYGLQPQPPKELSLKGYSIYSLTYFALQHRLTKTIRQSTPKKASLDDILEDIARVFNYTPEELIGKSRKEKRPLCRILFCYIAHRLNPGIKYRQLSQFIGYENHTSVIYALSFVKDSLKVRDPSFLDDWDFYLQNTNVFISTIHKNNHSAR